VPGSRLEYFVTANYIGQADNYLLPDTSGGNFFEIRFLPEYRDDGGVWKFPSLLYIDPGRLGDTVDRMLNVALAGASPADPLPEYRLWDHYTYLDAGCCWGSPFARGGDLRSTSGATILQLLGYRGIILTAGDRHIPFWSDDFELFMDWMRALHCEGDSDPRGLIYNGDRAAESFEVDNRFGPRVGVGPPLSDPYRILAGDENYCVRIEDVVGSSYPPSMAVDAWGNGCPDERNYNVLSPIGSGVGGRAFENVGTGQVTQYQQITNDVNDSWEGIYRSVVSSVSYDHLAVREQGDECTPTFDRIIEAGAAELSAALNWIFGGNVPGLHEDPCEGVTDVGTQPEVTASGTTRLLPAQPNPFSPRTRLRYELAATGPATLSVFDVGGRRVRVLTSGVQQAGPHEVVWDGTDDRGTVLPAGVYWSQLEATGYRTNKRLVVLR
ncbi:MAG: FlgD immunoglobulin-like domain containing protein, partial [Candidatus Eisenbacteria bacterium]